MRFLKIFSRFDINRFVCASHNTKRCCNEDGSSNPNFLELGSDRNGNGSRKETFESSHTEGCTGTLIQTRAGNGNGIGTEKFELCDNVGQLSMFSMFKRDRIPRVNFQRVHRNYEASMYTEFSSITSSC